MADAGAHKRHRSQAEQSIAMLPSWVVTLTAIELIGFLALALGIATAAPEDAPIHVGNESSLEKAR